ncbi:hypothetical protein Pfo_005371 [Paulownia fortunei]|nr:hypothetical protein Pfo_005371 [Paulownia fortunei]
MTVEEKEDWRATILAYLKYGLLSQDKEKAARIQSSAVRFCIVSDIVYKRAFSAPYLRCLSIDEGSYVLREIHEGCCRDHSGSKALIRKVWRVGYF